MVGDWADEVPAQNGISVHSTCDWTANQAFLIRKFKVEGRADVSRAGTEVIGWDPRAEDPFLGLSTPTAALVRTYGSRMEIAGWFGTPASGQTEAKLRPPTS